MGIYVMLTTLTDEGRKTVRDRPERIKEVNEEVKKMGAKILSQYVLFGPYDFVNILEAENDETVSKIAINLGARGTLQTMTVPAIPVDKFIESMKK